MVNSSNLDLNIVFLRFQALPGIPAAVLYVQYVKQQEMITYL